jgi:hypothetical protein
LAIRGVAFQSSMREVGLSRNGNKWWDLLLGDSHCDLLVNGNVNKLPNLGGEIRRLGVAGMHSFDMCTEVILPNGRELVGWIQSSHMTGTLVQGVVLDPLRAEA